MSKNKSPQAEANKYAVLWKTMFPGQFPVDVKKIALEISGKQNDFIEGIKTFSELGYGDIDCEGMLYYVQKDNRWFIVYNDQSKRSHNFTLAHEFGHYCLHRTRHQKFQCSIGDIGDKNIQDLKEMEREADTFASYLLMPIDDFKQQIEGQQISFDLFERCMNRYETSFTSVVLKWLEFTHLHAVLVVSVDGFILWSRSSRTAFKSGIYFKSGEELPEGSFAKQKIDHKSVENHNLPVAAWNYSYPVKELSFYSEAYEQTFTLLIFSGVGVDNYDNYQEEREEDCVDRFERFNHN